MWGLAVPSIHAPRGAVTSSQHLKKLIRRREPLYQFTVGSITEYVPDWSWKIIRNEYGSWAAHQLTPRWDFQVLRARYETIGTSVFHLRDYHIDGGGYNNNWIFTSRTAAEAHIERSMSAEYRERYTSYRSSIFDDLRDYEEYDDDYDDGYIQDHDQDD